MQHVEASQLSYMICSRFTRYAVIKYKALLLHTSRIRVIIRRRMVKAQDHCFWKVGRIPNEDRNAFDSPAHLHLCELLNYC